MKSRAAWILITLSPIAIWATEILRPVEAPATRFAVAGFEELDDDVYSTDMAVSAEYSPFRAFSVYADASFRFMSYSYEYSTEGYIHNYCNLHVNGFNETYIGAKFFFLPNFGLNFNWREDNHYKPGDEIGFKTSFIWTLGWNEVRRSGWKISETFLYQARFEESENRNLAKPYSKMKDAYRGMKMKFDAMHYFNIAGISTGFGLNYEIHEGTPFTDLFCVVFLILLLVSHASAGEANLNVDSTSISGEKKFRHHSLSVEYNLGTFVDYTIGIDNSYRRSEGAISIDYGYVPFENSGFETGLILNYSLYKDPIITAMAKLKGNSDLGEQISCYIEFDFGVMYYDSIIIPTGHFTALGIELGYPASLRFQVPLLLWGQRGVTYIGMGYRF